MDVKRGLIIPDIFTQRYKYQTMMWIVSFSETGVTVKQGTRSWYTSSSLSHLEVGKLTVIFTGSVEKWASSGFLTDSAFDNYKLSGPPPPHRLLLDRSSNIGPLNKFKNCWNKSFRNSKILTLLYQKFSKLLISQRDMSGPSLGTLSNNRWSGSTNACSCSLGRTYIMIGMWRPINGTEIGSQQ